MSVFFMDKTTLITLYIYILISSKLGEYDN